MSMKKRRGLEVRVALAMFWLVLLAAFAQAPQPARIVAIGDVHGDLDALTGILKKTGLIDQNDRWNGGSATLVQTGDLLDRGPQSRDVLDLMIALQKEAPRQKGSVKVSLGNHEMMNIMGDLRYVVAEDYAAFVDNRSEQRRKRAFQDYSKFQSEHGRPVDEAAWMEAHPLGFVERREAFGPGGAYGKWFRSLPAIVVVDGSAFLHGGISPELATWSIDKINGAVDTEIELFDKYKQYLIDKDVALPFFTLDELLTAVRAEVDAQKAETQSKQRRKSETAPDMQILEALLRLGAWVSVNENGPLWFRGYDRWTEEEGEAQITRLTRALKVQRIVVGHTPQPNGEIRKRFGGKVFLIDTGMLSSYFAGGRASALNIQDGKVSAIYLNESEAFN